MKPRRKGYQTFILKSAGMAEYLETNGQKKALIDKNGIVRVRPTKVNRSHEGKCRTYNNGLAAFVLNGRWHTTYSRIAAITKLLNRLIAANCEFNPPKERRNEVIDTLKKLAGVTPEALRTELERYINILEKKYHKYAYAKRLRQDLSKIDEVLAAFKGALTRLGIA